MDDSRICNDERESLERYYEQLTPAERRDRVFLVPAYRDAYNELVQAHRTVDQPAYFWERWVPVLGPVAAVLYMKLRQYCFSRSDGPADVCWPRQETLGKEIGVKCRERLRAALEDLQRHGFIEREYSSRMDPRSGRHIRTSDRYRVFFEIPLRPRDAAELLIRSVHQVEMPLDSPMAVKPPMGHQSPMAGIPLLGTSEPAPMAEIPPMGSPMAGIPPMRASGFTANGDAPMAGIPLAEVNVQRFQRSTLSEREYRQCEDSPADRLADELVEELNDPGSRKFYRLVADKLPHPRIRLVLSETRGARDQGLIERSPGAYFTGAIRRVARELGVAL